MNQKLSYERYLRDYYRHIERNFNASRPFSWSSPEEKIIHQILMSKRPGREKDLVNFIHDISRKSNEERPFPECANA